MERVLEYTPNTESRIVDYLQNSGYPNNLISYLRRECLFTYNGINVDINTLIKSQETFSMRIAENNDDEKIVPTDIPIEIVFQDEDILVVNKQANLPVHPSRNNFDGTLANAVAYKFNSEFPYRCLTRLDKDTTGLVLLAKNRIAASILSANRETDIKSEYVALVEGKTDEHGSICLPIAKNGNEIKRIVSDDGQYALTEYELIEYYKSSNISLIRLHLKTGRTHQIRVHMSSIGHPLIGDNLYGGKTDIVKTPMLHVDKMTIIHPITRNEIIFNAEMTKSFKKCLTF